MRPEPLPATRGPTAFRVVGTAAVAAFTAGLLAVTAPASDRPARAQGGPTNPPTRTPAPTPTAAAAPGLCTVSGAQIAGTTTIEIRRSAPFRFSLSASCPEDARGRADILLLFDTSASMKDDDKIDAAKAAVRRFVDNVDFDRHRVGLVPFNYNPYVGQPLTFNRDYLLRALDAIKAPEGGTNIAEAIILGDRELLAAGRREAVPILVLLTDGQSSPEPMRAAAQRARDRGVTIFAIGLGSDAAQDELRAVATSSEHYSYAPGPEGLAQIYERIAAMIREVMVTDVVIHDTLAADVTYVAGSGRPRNPLAIEGGRHPAWGIGFLTSDASVVAYDVRIDRGGRVEPSASIWVEYADGDGTRRRVDIAPAAIDVTVPDTHRTWLPMLWKHQCVPATRYADVVLAIDNSSSMTGEPLAEAVVAATQFVSLLDLRFDRAAVVAFDAEARLLQPLTRDRAALERALAGLAPGAGTRLDRALVVAMDALVGLAPQVGNRPVIVLLSDGRQSEAAPLVHDAARLARERGIVVFAVGLGDDVDRPLLTTVAGSPARTYFAPRPGDLAEIYRQVAGIVGCK